MLEQRSCDFCGRSEGKVVYIDDFSFETALHWPQDLAEEMGISMILAELKQNRWQTDVWG